MNFICISGQMRSGKNLAGSYICENFGFKEASFARPVKDIFCNAFGVDMDFVEKWKVIDSNPPSFTKNVRQSLQFIGDGFRQIQPDIWVDYAFLHNSKKTCFTDGRYINELSRIKAEGGINILLRRPGYENNDPNQSEAQIKKIVDWFVANSIPEGKVDFVSGEAPKGCEYIDFFIVNDGSIHEFNEKIRKILI